MGNPRVVVVGAGVGGLTAALELVQAGLQVTLVEAAATPGGKMREVQPGGRGMDAGPTVFTMRWVFDELFERLGTRVANHLTLRPASVLARHAWAQPGGDVVTLDLFADLAASADAIGAFAGPAEARRFLGFSERARRVYQTLERPFLHGQRPSPVSLTTRVGWRGLPGLARISPFTTLWSALGAHFHDPRLRQLFGRYATYCGSSPFHAPATLMLVAHVEQAGVWLVDGGMHRLATVLADMAVQRGAALHYRTRCRQLVVRSDRITGVEIEHPDGKVEHLSAEAVVFNGDAAALSHGLLGSAVGHATRSVLPAQRSLSAITWNLLATTQGFPLQRHTVFFSNDYPLEFEDIRSRGHAPSAPTVYICAQDRDSAGSLRIAGAERLLCLINAPATGDTDPFDAATLGHCEAAMQSQLARCGLQVDRQGVPAVVTSPRDFERLFPGTGGGLYGQASHGWMASFSRPGARTPVAGLYLAGGSVHPGPGVPMAALSGHLAATSVLEDSVKIR